MGQQKNEMLEDIRRRAPLPRDVAPESALSAVVCALDQHITGGESRHLYLSLPPEVHPMLAPCLVHRGEAAARFGWDGLVKRVAEHLRIGREDAEGMIPGVIAALSARLPASEVEHVATQLPEDIRHLWAGPKETPPARSGPHDVLEEVESLVSLPPGADARTAVAAVVCTLSRRLPMREARHLVEHLPESVRPSIAHCLEDRGEPPPDTYVERLALFERVAAAVRAEQVEPLVRAVFHAIQHDLPHDEVHRIHAQLPRDLQRLWADPWPRP